MTFRGILDESLGGYLTFRGFAKLGDIENLSEPDPAYQRDLITTHQEEIKKFLTSGKHLFFPEVILGCKIAENDELDKVNPFFEAYRQSGNNRFTFKKMIVEFRKETIKFQIDEDIRSEKYFRAVILKFLQKHLELAKTNKPFKRIDGNHRISASNLDENIKKLNIPFCIVFFRNQEEEEKYSRVIFHNINYKSIPLSMEESLKLILENETLFPDNELQGENFGWEYYFTRKINKQIIDEHFANIKNVFDNQFRTTFLKLFRLLIEKGFLEKSEESIHKVKNALSNINEIYSNDILKNSNNGALFSTFMYFKLADENLLNGFKKWVLKNHIYDLKEVEPKSLVDIYTKIAQSKIKNIFVAMAFNENNSNNVWDAISTVYDDLTKQENLQLDRTKLEDGKYIPNRVDKGLDVSKDIIYEIKKGISNADLVIVDLSYGKQNVYYEMGLAEAQQKPIIILHDESIQEDKIHFDVSTQSRISYNSNNLPELKVKLKKVLKTIIEGE